MEETLITVLGFLGYLLAGVVPSCVVLYLLYFLLTLPMRRNERARLFLDVLELGIQQGDTPEAAVANVAASHDRSLGIRFYLLAERLRGGMKLSQGLQAVPRLLPPQVTAMILVGERIGSVGKVVPACRQVLQDGVSQVRGALNYVLILVFVASPAMVFVPGIVTVKVIPKFEEIFVGMMEGMQMPALTRMVFGEQRTFLTVELATIAFMWLLLVAYLGGPRLRQWVTALVPGLPAAISRLLPWRWKRAQRDFSATLALLLDAGIPETEAVSLASEAAGNQALMRGTKSATQALAQGVKLPEALGAIDDSGELRWRIENAAHGRGGFVASLRGWHEALDARAFQLEQTAAQTLTVALVLLNGLFVGMFVIGVFLALISLINSAALW